MARHKVAETDDFEDGSRVIADVGGHEVAVFRLDGEYHALANYCVHQAGPLCEGDLSGRMRVGEDGWEWHYDETETVIACPWHGWQFDVATGVSVKDDRYRVPRYEVVVEDGDVFVVR